ncbi:MAG: RNA-binding S4 domain-containing protein [Lachnospiraceae bacterium]|nr:RNA-binding S4 domain-containing protein [Lachnospiraceae bacterium]
MDTITLRAGETYIKLGQALKKAGYADSGAGAHIRIAQGEVLVNGKKEVRRGRKLYAGDVFTCDGKEVSVEA